MDELKQKYNEAVKIAKLLFDRGKVTGATGNISFRLGEKIYISASGSCMGWLTENDFAIVDVDGKVLSTKIPSKELPLHKIIYDVKPEVRAVIHTHSFYSTLWSCLSFENEDDIMPSVTPYLKMKTGTIGLIPAAEPGSVELFQYLQERVLRSDGFLLAHHGAVLSGPDLLSVFYSIEELEETAKMNWYLKMKGDKRNG